jgi:hypothetical protein
VHLREVAIGVFLLALGEPLCTRLGDAAAVTAVAIAGIAIRRSHESEPAFVESRQAPIILGRAGRFPASFQK